MITYPRQKIMEHHLLKRDFWWDMLVPRRVCTYLYMYCIFYFCPIFCLLQSSGSRALGWKSSASKYSETSWAFMDIRWKLLRNQVWFHLYRYASTANMYIIPILDIPITYRYHGCNRNLRWLYIYTIIYQKHPKAIELYNHSSDMKW